MSEGGGAHLQAGTGGSTRETEYPTEQRKKAERGRKKLIPFPPFYQWSDVELAVPHTSFYKLEARALYCPKTTM